jgi:hypothetical protein
MGKLFSLLLAVTALAACMPTGPGDQSYYGNPGYGRPTQSDGPPSVDNLSGRSREALRDGCRRRYDNERKINECMNGYRHSEDALIDGCNARYNGAPDKLRECLRALR